MENSTRTVYGSYIQTCLLLGIPPTYPENSTLNEKFGILAGTLPSQLERPKLGYWAIGNRGHQNVIGAEGIAKTEPVQHRATDAAGYGHIPFVLRAVNDDLTTVERAKYALRKEITVDGSVYIAYYLKRIDMTGVVPKMENKVVTGGVEVVTPFVPNSSNLNPTPPVVNNNGVNVVDGEYVTASARLDLSLTESDIQELLNMAKILYGDEGFAIVSEVMLCTGVDKAIQVSTQFGGTFNFNEAIGVQVASHIYAHVPAKFSNQGSDINVAVGATEPLYALQQV